MFGFCLQCEYSKGESNMPFQRTSIPKNTLEKTCFPHFPLQLQMRKQMRHNLCWFLPRKKGGQTTLAGLVCNWAISSGTFPQGGRDTASGRLLPECVHPAPKGDTERGYGAGNFQGITALISKYSY